MLRNTHRVSLEDKRKKKYDELSRVKIRNASSEYTRIPVSTLDTLVDYVNHGLSCGDFLTAMLEQDLYTALFHADRQNYGALREIGLCIYNVLPRDCWGSKEKCADWRHHQGISGLRTHDAQERR